MGCHCLQYTVTPSIDPQNHDSPAVCPWHPATTCVAIHATAPMSHFSKAQCSARVSQDCLCTVTTIPWSARYPDLSPIQDIWDDLIRSTKKYFILVPAFLIGTKAQGGPLPSQEAFSRSAFYLLLFSSS
ncbi:hypothetical protein TNCV_491731 [Trichonephila clavipes]|nr:hypothetical protein TNCV_491731 [Trichonephila clavipes]